MRCMCLHLISFLVDASPSIALAARHEALGHDAGSVIVGAHSTGR